MFDDQLGYPEHSPFYRTNYAGCDLGDFASLPLTDKRELKATTTRENPFGAHLCVRRDEIVRVYSTSGRPARRATSHSLRATSTTGYRLGAQLRCERHRPG